jgi:hypothetical protein
MGYEQKARDRVGRASQLKYDPAELLLRQEKCPAGVLTSCMAWLGPLFSRVLLFLLIGESRRCSAGRSRCSILSCGILNAGRAEMTQREHGPYDFATADRRSPSAVVLTITPSLGRSMTRRSRIAARGPARSSYRPAEGCRSVRLRVRPAERAGPARRHWRRLSRFEPAGLPWDNPLPNASGRGPQPPPHPVPVRQCLFRAACNMGLRAWS